MAANARTATAILTLLVNLGLLMKSMHFLGLCAAMFLAACATPPTRYVAPTAGPTATLEIKSTVYSGNYAVEIFNNGTECSGRSPLTTSYPGVPSYNPRSETVLSKIPGTGTQTLWFRYFEGNRYCNVIHSFVAKPDKKYSLSVNVAGNTCQSLLLDTSNGNTAIPEGLTKRYYVPPFMGGDSAKWCLALNAADYTSLSKPALPISSSGPASAPPKPTTIDDLDGLIGPAK